VPDGTYDYFQWENNRWVFKEDLFHNMKIDNKDTRVKENKRKARGSKFDGVAPPDKKAKQSKSQTPEDEQLPQDKGSDDDR
jgi:hypothetical protein